MYTLSMLVAHVVPCTGCRFLLARVARPHWAVVASLQLLAGLGVKHALLDSRRSKGKVLEKMSFFLMDRRGLAPAEVQTV